MTVTAGLMSHIDDGSSCWTNEREMQTL